MTMAGVTSSASADIVGSCAIITLIRPSMVSTSRDKALIKRLSVPLADEEIKACRAINSVEWRAP